MLDKLKGFFGGFIICVIISLLTSCKTRQSVVKERVVYDTVWTEKTLYDSTGRVRTEKEITRIVPHVIRLKDTTIVYSDTTIIRNVDGRTMVYKEYYQNKGHVSKDSARVEEKKAAPNKNVAKKDSSHKWQLLWYGVLIGILVTLCFKYRKKINTFIKRLAKRIIG